ncbi:M48 family metallopeptidase [Rhodobacteraceae bacterium]|nr:M48 family metallopeptidase [Paracoccaceae bacterium]
MGQFRVGSGAGVPVDMRRSARARRISLRVSTLDGRVTLTVPKHVSAEVALEFAEEKSDWIARALEKQSPAVPIVMGSQIPVEGRPHLIVAGKGRTARITDDVIEAPTTRVGASVQALLKARARARLVAASDRYAAALGRDYGRITMRDTRSRWGSCSHDGNLMYSWRLILAPLEVLDYVAAHEVAHLAHMDHSKNFWNAVEGLCPGYKAPRNWLRREGTSLHSYRFSSND